MTPTMKHAFGRIASRYDPAEGLARVLADPEFRALFPDAKMCRGGTAVDFGDGEEVDVLVPVRPAGEDAIEL